MIKCKNCSKEMTKKDAICPECGTKRNWFVRHKILSGIGIFFILIVIIPSDKTPRNEVNTVASVTTTKQTTIQNTTVPTSIPIPTASPKPIPREYMSALKKAETYAKTMHMSKKAIHNQLTSEYGEKFSKEASQYAIDNLEYDWNSNALNKAKTYQDTMNMSPSAIRDQLVSEYGEKFTKEQADYAVDNLNK